jgi:hypothetical protein
MAQYTKRNRGPPPIIGKRCDACENLLNQCWACQHVEDEQRKRKRAHVPALPPSSPHFVDVVPPSIDTTPPPAAVPPICSPDDRTQWQRIKIFQAKSLIWRSLVLGFSKYVCTKREFQHFVICEQCASSPATIQHCEIDYGASKSTSNIKSHVQVYHKPDYDAFLLKKTHEIKKQAVTAGSGSSHSIASFFPVAMSNVSMSQKENEVKLLIKLIVCNHLPLAIVDSAMFRDYAKCLSSKASLFSRSTIGDELRLEFLACKVKAIAMFDNICPSGHASVTVDHWTSISNQTYASLTCHVITKDWEIVNMPFTICKISGHTTGEDIATDVALMCAQSKVNATCAVTDCEASMVAASRLMSHAWQGCTNHRLEKVAKKIFDSPTHAIALKKARKVAGHFHSSSQASEQLKLTTKLVMKKFLTTLQDVETRWWSTWSCCHRLIQLRGSLSALEQVEDGIYIPSELRLTSDEWNILEVCVCILEPFMEAEKTLEGEKYVTASLTIPILFLIRNKIETQINSPVISEETRLNLGTVMDAFVQRFGTFDSTLPPASQQYGNAIEGKNRQPNGFTEMQCMASALDIRTKSRFWLPTRDHPRLNDVIVRKAVELHSSVSPPRSTFAPPVVNPPSFRSGVSFDAFSPHLAIDDGVDGVVVNADVELRAECTRELLLFNAVPQSSGCVNATNPLDWWRSNAFKFPILARVARDCLQIPSTSGSSERLFSEAGLVSTKKRNRLLHERIEELVFLQKWYAFLQAHSDLVK